MDEVMEKVNEVVAKLNGIQEQEYAAKGYTFRDFITVKKVAKKFIYIDVGGSGAWLVERGTGEIFNIKGYGVPDYNKKVKADIGNIKTVDPEVMYNKRWNYLR